MGILEWLILCLLVPAIVVPIVLLWGFVGCDFETKVRVSAPDKLVATPLSVTAVRLSWENEDLRAVRYEVERLDPTATKFVKVADATGLTVDDGGLNEGASYEYRVIAFDDDNDPSKPSLPVRVDLFFKTAFARTAAESAQLINDPAPVPGFGLVQRIVGAPASPRLLLTGTNVKLTLRGSTVADLLIDRIFISSAHPSSQRWDSDPSDLTLVATNVLLKFVEPPVTVGPTGLVANGDKIYILEREKDLIIAFDIGNPGNPRFGPLIPPSASATFAKLPPGEAAIAERSPNYVENAALYLIEKIEVLEIGRSEV